MSQKFQPALSTAMLASARFGFLANCFFSQSMVLSSGRENSQ